MSIYQPCHIWMSNVTPTHTESCHTYNELRHAHEWVLVGRATPMNTSCHAYERRVVVTSHRNGSCHICMSPQIPYSCILPDVVRAYEFSIIVLNMCMHIFIYIYHNLWYYLVFVCTRTPGRERRIDRDRLRQHGRDTQKMLFPTLECQEISFVCEEVFFVCWSFFVCILL